ncbi:MULTISPECIES: DMT family transporter [unclassified Acinetobacter]|uniref:DMT family transporter n=1 Tax=unclassified Acinetobacter TaxID=196816 RepID=UPI0035BA79A4
MNNPTTPSLSTSHINKPANTANQGSYLGSFWMVLAALSFTMMGILVKLASQKFAMHEHELVFWRVIFATLILGTQALLLKQSFKTAYPMAHFGRSFVGSISLLMFFYSIAHLPLATAITFSHTSALFLAILSVIILKQMPSKLTWFALGLGFFGILLLLRPAILHNGLVPSLMGVSCGLFAGYAYLQVRELSLKGEPTWRIVFYFSLLASIMSALTSSIKGWTSISIESLPYLFGIGCFAIIGQIAMTHAYKVGRKFMVAALGYLVVVLSTLYSVFVLQEHLGLLAISGICLIVLSGLLAGIKK